ncbi:MAG TPA: hypothetical protein VFH54_15745 [Mycobacteriales bacterium]|nr:hypothetical protein [Mycobacteriales bacterium]
MIEEGVVEIVVVVGAALVTESVVVPDEVLKLAGLAESVYVAVTVWLTPCGGLVVKQLAFPDVSSGTVVQTVLPPMLISAVPVGLAFESVFVTVTAKITFVFGATTFVGFPLPSSVWTAVCVVAGVTVNGVLPDDGL